LLGVLLAGCAAPGAESHASAAQRVACAQRADSVFAEQHRGAIYASDAYVSSTRDAPFSGAGLVGTPDAGLSDRYDRDKIQSECLDGINGAPGPAAGPAAPAAK
jgi:hypothetical protein